MHPLSRLLVASLILLCTRAYATNPELSLDEPKERAASPSPVPSLLDFDPLKPNAPAASANINLSPHAPEENLDFIWVGCNLETMRFIICPCPGIIIPGAVHTQGIFWEISLEDLEKKAFRYSA